MTPRKKRITRKLLVPVVGMQYRVTAYTRKLISDRVAKKPLACRVEREPDNSADGNAIRVIIDEGTYEKLHIGYLPRGTAEVLSPALDSGRIEISQCSLMHVEPFDGDGDVLLTLLLEQKSPVNKRFS